MLTGLAVAAVTGLFVAAAVEAVLVHHQVRRRRSAQYWSFVVFTLLLWAVWTLGAQLGGRAPA